VRWCLRRWCVGFGCGEAYDVGFSGYPSWGYEGLEIRKGILVQTLSSSKAVRNSRICESVDRDARRWRLKWRRCNSPLALSWNACNIERAQYKITGLVNLNGCAVDEDQRRELGIMLASVRWLLEVPDFRWPLCSSCSIIACQHILRYRPW
jgi:hypothetical protein